ncbi:MAG: hypothetical protein SOT18_08975 [Eubacterium sp.]|nr:hypothetical protein [Eubacterium sp.]
MEREVISFLSSQGRGLSIDLALTKNYLQSLFADQDMSFRYYVNNEKSKNALANEGFIRARKEFCQDMKDVICVDPSLGARAGNLAVEGNKILLAVPYPYLITRKRGLRKGKHNNYKTLRNFTHIVAGSPFAEKVIRHAYELTGTHIIKNTALPFSWDLLQEERQEQVRREFTNYFPQSEGKKIAALLVFGDISKMKKTPFHNVNVQELADSIGKDWFFVTNSQELAEASYVLPAEYKDRFGYVNRIMPTQNLLYIADSLVTNNSRFAGSYAIRRKPVHAIHYTGNVFEKYVQEEYNDMYIGQIDKEMVKIQGGQMRPDQQAFCKEMSYENPKEPYAAIGEIFTNPRIRIETF